MLLYLVMGFLYIFFGVKIYMQTNKILQSFTINNNPKLAAKFAKSKKILVSVTVFSVATFIFFVLRAGFLLWQVIKTTDISACYWWIDLVYYFFLEIIPLVTVFVMFKYLPSKARKNGGNEFIAKY